MNRIFRSAAMRCVGIGCAGVAMLGAPASAAVIGATVADASSGDYTLTSVSVNRGSGTFTYVPSQLTGVDVTDIAATGSSIAVQGGASVPAAGTRATMLEDGRIDTGLINPFSTGSPEADSFEVTFLSPVVNSDGPDIIVFEIGTGDPTAFWVNNDRANHRHDVVAASFRTNLLTGVPFTQYAYVNPAGGSNVTGLEALESPTGWDGAGTDGTTPIAAVALDLDDFGIAPGGSITSLRWQTTSTGSRLDAVYVAGLPAVPEPAGVALLSLGGLALLRRKRSPGV